MRLKQIYFTHYSTQVNASYPCSQFNAIPYHVMTELHGILTTLRGLIRTFGSKKNGSHFNFDAFMEFTLLRL